MFILPLGDEGERNACFTDQKQWMLKSNTGWMSHIVTLSGFIHHHQYFVFCSFEDSRGTLYIISEARRPWCAKPQTYHYKFSLPGGRTHISIYLQLLPVLSLSLNSQSSLLIALFCSKLSSTYCQCSSQNNQGKNLSAPFSSKVL